ncbi:hypothetical protein GSI_06488 [Ganoderma sinense ZZ0214-1]|uniref:Uncharacterized protein n=1 Tax=Ganoderma sinense ZZ0214-1 TaxID=1077348 RepID=A0A2G8SDD4_9APHY|nr:hypothetical protein GSI_06488 [Ganoderma sinense ZZ0214-1]
MTCFTSATNPSESSVPASVSSESALIDIDLGSLWSSMVGVSPASQLPQETSQTYEPSLASGGGASSDIGLSTIVPRTATPPPSTHVRNQSGRTPDTNPADSSSPRRVMPAHLLNRLTFQPPMENMAMHHFQARAGRSGSREPSQVILSELPAQQVTPGTSHQGVLHIGAPASRPGGDSYQPPEHPVEDDEEEPDAREEADADAGDSPGHDDIEDEDVPSTCTSEYLQGRFHETFQVLDRLNATPNPYGSLYSWIIRIHKVEAVLEELEIGQRRYEVHSVIISDAGDPFEITCEDVKKCFGFNISLGE